MPRDDMPQPRNTVYEAAPHKDYRIRPLYWSLDYRYWLGVGCGILGSAIGHAVINYML